MSPSVDVAIQELAAGIQVPSQQESLRLARPP